MRSIEERVAKLEEMVFGSHEGSVQRDDWLKSVGTVTDDAMSREIIDGALRRREEERERARHENGLDSV